MSKGLQRNPHSPDSEQGSVDRSGHWDHYRENMYFTEIDENPFAIKPMNCPGDAGLQDPDRSYRDLPMRVAELGMVHDMKEAAFSTDS